MPCSRTVWTLGVLLSHLIAPAFLLAQQDVVRDLFRGTPEFKQGDPTEIPTGREAVWSGHLNLGVNYLGMFRFAEAESQFRSGVALAEKFETDDLRLPETLNWLGQALMFQGKYSEAERLYKQSLVMFEKTLGEKSPRVAQCLGHLATLNSMQGQFAQAEPFRKRALAIYEATFSRDSPFLLGNILDLAHIYRQQGKCSEAESQYKKALARLEEVKGPDDPKVADLLLDYASLLKTMNREVEAEGLQARAQVIREKWSRTIPID